MYSKRCCTHIEINLARGVQFFGFVWSCHIKQTHGLHHVSLSYVAIPTHSRHHGLVRMRDGHEYFSVASRNRASTVCFLLFVPHFKKQISRENPSIHPWMTNHQLIRLWCSSICHRLFGPGTEYVLLVITVAHLSREFCGSTLLKQARTRSL